MGSATLKSLYSCKCLVFFPLLVTRDPQSLILDPWKVALLTFWKRGEESNLWLRDMNPVFCP